MLRRLDFTLQRNRSQRKYSLLECLNIYALSGSYRRMFRKTGAGSLFMERCSANPATPWRWLLQLAMAHSSAPWLVSRLVRCALPLS